MITLERLPFPLRYLPHLVTKVVNWFSSPVGFHYKGRVTRFCTSDFSTTTMMSRSSKTSYLVVELAHPLRNPYPRGLE